MNTTYSILIITLFVITSCNNSKQNKDYSRVKTRLEKWGQINKIVRKYNAHRGLDTLYFASTYEFQKFLSVEDTYLINPRRIFDFAEKDSAFRVTIDIKEDSSPTVYNYAVRHKLVLDCTLGQWKKINPFLPDVIPSSNAVAHRSNAYLIVRLHTAKKERHKGFTFTGEVVEIIQKNN